MVHLNRSTIHVSFCAAAPFVSSLYREEKPIVIGKHYWVLHLKLHVNCMLKMLSHVKHYHPYEKDVFSQPIKCSLVLEELVVWCVSYVDGLGVSQALGVSQCLVKPHAAAPGHRGLSPGLTHPEKIFAVCTADHLGFVLSNAPVI